MINRLSKIKLLTLCYLSYFKRGRADRKPKVLRKILVVQMASMGDMVCTTPLFRAIKNLYPDSSLFIMGNKINKQILAGNPDISEYIIYENFEDTLKKIKSINFDFACTTAPNFNILAMLYLAGIPIITAPRVVNGFSPYQTRAYLALLPLVLTEKHKMGSYAPWEYLKLVRSIGVESDDIKKKLYYSNDAEMAISKIFQDNGVIVGTDFIAGISPSAGNKIKRWERDKFAGVADYLYSKYNAKIVILGGPGDLNESEEMIKSLDPNTKYINITGKLSVEELKALISKLSIVISVDSAPIYIAEAFGVPTVDIIGPIDEREQPPIGPSNKIVVAKRNKPELYVMNARIYDESEARRQIESITAEMVTSSIQEIVGQIKK